MTFCDLLTAARSVSPWRLIDQDDPLVEIDGDLAGAILVLEQRCDDGSARVLREIHALRSIYVRREMPTRFRLVNAGPQSRVIVAGVEPIFPLMKRIRTSLAADVGEDEDVLEVA